jgi:hypothetical protein
VLTDPVRSEVASVSLANATFVSRRTWEPASRVMPRDQIQWVKTLSGNGVIQWFFLHSQ